MKVLVPMLLGVMACTAHAADLYKWKDAEGHVHYTDQPPPASAKSVERKNGKGNLIESDAMPFETQQAAKKYPVSLYSFNDCGAPCNDAEAYLAKRGVPYTLKNSEEDKAALEKLTGDRQIPVLVVGGQKPLKGYQEQQWSDLLDMAGYPKTNPLAKLKNTPAAQKPASKE